MNREFSTKVVCPHCNFKQQVSFEVYSSHGYSPPFLTVCELEEGGCERMFVVKPSVEIKTEVFKVEEK